jgi:hypothetical protein
MLGTLHIPAYPPSYPTLPAVAAPFPNDPTPKPRGQSLDPSSVLPLLSSTVTTSEPQLPESWREFASLVGNASTSKDLFGIDGLLPHTLPQPPVVAAPTPALAAPAGGPNAAAPREHRRSSRHGVGRRARGQAPRAEEEGVPAPAPGAESPHQNFWTRTKRPTPSVGVPTTIEVEPDGTTGVIGSAAAPASRDLYRSFADKHSVKKPHHLAPAPAPEAPGPSPSEMAMASGRVTRRPVNPDEIPMLRIKPGAADPIPTWAAVPSDGEDPTIIGAPEPDLSFDQADEAKQRSAPTTATHPIPLWAASQANKDDPQESPDVMAPKVDSDAPAPERPTPSSTADDTAAPAPSPEEEITYESSSAATGTAAAVDVAQGPETGGAISMFDQPSAAPSVDLAPGFNPEQAAAVVGDSPSAGPSADFTRKEAAVVVDSPAAGPSADFIQAFETEAAPPMADEPSVASPTGEPNDASFPAAPLESTSAAASAPEGVQGSIADVSHVDKPRGHLSTGGGLTLSLVPARTPPLPDALATLEGEMDRVVNGFKQDDRAFEIGAGSFQGAPLQRSKPRTDGLAESDQPLDIPAPKLPRPPQDWRPFWPVPINSSNEIPVEAVDPAQIQIWAQNRSDLPAFRTPSDPWAAASFLLHGSDSKSAGAPPTSGAPLPSEQEARPAEGSPTGSPASLGMIRPADDKGFRAAAADLARIVNPTMSARGAMGPSGPGLPRLPGAKEDGVTKAPTPALATAAGDGASAPTGPGLPWWTAPGQDEMWRIPGATFAQQRSTEAPTEAAAAPTGPGLPWWTAPGQDEMWRVPRAKAAETENADAPAPLGLTTTGPGIPWWAATGQDEMWRVPGASFVDKTNPAEETASAAPTGPGLPWWTAPGQDEQWGVPGAGATSAAAPASAPPKGLGKGKLSVGQDEGFQAAASRLAGILNRSVPAPAGWGQAPFSASKGDKAVASPASAPEIYARAGAAAPHGHAPGPRTAKTTQTHTPSSGRPHVQDLSHAVAGAPQPSTQPIGLDETAGALLTGNVPAQDAIPPKVWPTGERDMTVPGPAPTGNLDVMPDMPADAVRAAPPQSDENSFAFIGEAPAPLPAGPLVSQITSPTEAAAPGAQEMALDAGDAPLPSAGPEVDLAPAPGAEYMLIPGGDGEAVAAATPAFAPAAGEDGSGEWPGEAPAFAPLVDMDHDVLPVEAPADAPVGTTLQDVQAATPAPEHENSKQNALPAGEPMPDFAISGGDGTALLVEAPAPGDGMAEPLAEAPFDAFLFHGQGAQSSTQSQNLSPLPASPFATAPVEAPDAPTFESLTADARASQANTGQGPAAWASDANTPFPMEAPAPDLSSIDGPSMQVAPVGAPAPEALPGGASFPGSSPQEAHPVWEDISAQGAGTVDMLPAAAPAPEASTTLWEASPAEAPLSDDASSGPAGPAMLSVGAPVQDDTFLSGTGPAEAPSEDGAPVEGPTSLFAEAPIVSAAPADGPAALPADAPIGQEQPVEGPASLPADAPSADDEPVEGPTALPAGAPSALEQLVDGPAYLPAEAPTADDEAVEGPAPVPVQAPTADDQPVAGPTTGPAEAPNVDDTPAEGSAALPAEAPNADDGPMDGPVALPADSPTADDAPTAASPILSAEAPGSEAALGDVSAEPDAKPPLPWDRPDESFVPDGVPVAAPTPAELPIEGPATDFMPFPFDATPSESPSEESPTEAGAPTGSPQDAPMPSEMPLGPADPVDAPLAAAPTAEAPLEVAPADSPSASGPSSSDRLASEAPAPDGVIAAGPSPDDTSNATEIPEEPSSAPVPSAAGPAMAEAPEPALEGAYAPRMETEVPAPAPVINPAGAGKTQDTDWAGELWREVTQGLLLPTNASSTTDELRLTGGANINSSGAVPTPDQFKLTAGADVNASTGLTAGWSAAWGPGPPLRASAAVGLQVTGPSLRDVYPNHSSSQLPTTSSPG